MKKGLKGEIIRKQTRKTRQKIIIIIIKNCIKNTDKANILTQRKREHKQQRKWEYKQKME